MVTDDAGTLRPVVAERAVEQPDGQRAWSMPALLDLIDHLPGAVYRCDTMPQRCLLLLNRAAVELFARPREELLTSPPRSYLDLVHLDDRAEVARATTLAAEQRGSYDLTYRIDQPGRHPRWVRDRGRCVVDPLTGHAQLDGFVCDVDDHVRTEGELERSRQRLGQAQTMARLGFWEFDVGADTVTWSPMIYDIFGLPHSIVPQPETFYRAVHPDDLERVRAAEREGAATGGYEVVHRIVRPDGAVRVIQECVTAERDEERVVRLTGTAQDVTELTETQASLRASEARLQRVLEATDDGWWDNDVRAGRVVLAPRWWAIHGYEPDELPATTTLWRELLHPDDLPRIAEIDQRIFGERARSFAYECRALHKDGHAVPVMIRGIVEYDDGRPVRVSGATTDLTEAKHIERMKNEFVASVSHELRTPLTSISGALALVTEGMSGPLPPKAAQLVRIAHANSERLGLLIDDLLDMEMMISDKLRFDVQVQPLMPVVEQALRDNAAYADRYEVRFTITERADDVLVAIDPVRLQQVLTNYLSNAAKFSPPGEDIEVVVRRLSPVFVRVEVNDQGSGVPEAFRDRVFDSFSQADSSDGRKRGGTGLGLAISKGIVERLAGRVGLDATKARTCFYFDLPIHATAAP